MSKMPTSSSISQTSALSFSSNRPLVLEPAMIAERSKESTCLSWRDLENK